MIKLTDTLTGEKQPFEPLRPPQVTMYVCGVTVYDDCHIGHARGAVVFDVLRRWLESPRYGYKLRYVRNITDLDDKIIDRARGLTPGSRELEGATGRGLTPFGLREATQAVASFYTRRFQADLAKLGLLPPDEEPKATEFIPQMQELIQDLIRRGMAYQGSDGVYFSVRGFSARHPYGSLSRQKLDEMLEGGPGSTVEGKKDPLDFALWKKAKPDEPAWESPWGPGRPGWHIECTAMSTRLLGDEFDLHGGGQDLIFPHHENELAQALGAGKPFARRWLHNGLLTVNGQKMSKSLGNFVTVGEALQRHPADVLRLFFLGAHYRSPLDFTWERLDEADSAYYTLVMFLEHAGNFPHGEETTEIQKAEEKFHAAMEDDLNTPKALSALYDLRGAVTHGKTDAVQATAMIEKLGQILGLSFSAGSYSSSSSCVADPEEVQELVRERDEARRKRDFAVSDRIRQQLTEMGYVVEDTSAGTVVRKRA